MELVHNNAVDPPQKRIVSIETIHEIFRPAAAVVYVPLFRGAPLQQPFRGNFLNMGDQRPNIEIRQAHRELIKEPTNNVWEVFFINIV